MENTETNFLDKVKKLSDNDSSKEKVLKNIKNQIEGAASFGKTEYSYTLRSFNREIERSLNVLDNGSYIATFYIEVLEYVISSLRKEGFIISFPEHSSGLIHINIYW